jgi:hypothetical protein
MDNMNGSDGLSNVRSVFEKAITAAGLHVTEVRFTCKPLLYGRPVRMKMEQSDRNPAVRTGLPNRFVSKLKTNFFPSL